ncbi:hypothetical protein [Cohnella abietis]|uniref:Uncharacterized protein n=1 Tax=Cohnella abietis TaxID=2507935 RepID=A0A3T1D192_9BACL|nr:hypothetical protein [Cohnella abietis]BBI31877.1 hypothetical protein KCTCHS21_12760 [Cohnella abietis]
MMKFTYELHSIGWANTHLQVEDSEIYIEPSYLSEPLIDLVQSVESLVPECVEPDEMKNIVQFDWDSEPAIHNWIIEKRANGMIQISIVLYRDGIKTLPGEIVFDRECLLDDFIINIVESMELLLKKHGFIGYRKQWNRMDFPISSYLQLKNYLMNRNRYPIVIKNQDEWNESIESNLSEELQIIDMSVV